MAPRPACAVGSSGTAVVDIARPIGENDVCSREVTRKGCDFLLLLSVAQLQALAAGARLAGRASTPPCRHPSRPAPSRLRRRQWPRELPRSKCRAGSRWEFRAHQFEEVRGSAKQPCYTTRTLRRRRGVRLTPPPATFLPLLDSWAVGRKGVAAAVAVELFFVGKVAIDARVKPFAAGQEPAGGRQRRHSARRELLFANVPDDIAPQPGQVEEPGQVVVAFAGILTQRASWRRAAATASLQRRETW